MGSWSARTKRSDDFAAPEWAGKRNHKGDRLLFFSLRGRPRGRSVLPRLNLEAISALPIQFSDWSLPIQTFTNRRKLIFLYWFGQRLVIPHRTWVDRHGCHLHTLT